MWALAVNMSRRNRWDISNKPAQPTTVPAHTAAQAAAAAIAARINEAVAALQQKIEPPESKVFSEGCTKMISCDLSVWSTQQPTPS
jgi:hypothetical protein